MASRLIRTCLCLTTLFTCAVAGSLANGQLVNFTPAGVEIDASGILRTKVFNDATGELTRARYAAAQQTLSADIQEATEFRKVSLNRLEAEIRRRLESGEGIDATLRNLAGLTRITHVFFYPESGDIVIAGPAEGFYEDASGRAVGMQSGKAILQLEDLIVALRAFGPNSPSQQTLGCSIDPTQEGLGRYQQTVAQIAAQAQSNQFRVAGNEQRIVDAIREAMGKQVVSIHGVPATTHFAQVLVEADYRMKLIGLGLERVPVDISVWADHVKPRKVNKNALQRWYFTPDYERIRVNNDETAMEFVGQGIQLVGASELVSASGNRSASQAVDRASENFTRTFTENYGDLADVSPVYAQLRNLMDMSIAAAFIKEMDYYGKAGWDLGVLADESQLPTEVYPAPQFVEPIVNGMYKDAEFAAPIGGGVTIQPKRALTVDTMKVDDSGNVEEARQNVELDNLAEGQWWWN